MTKTTVPDDLLPMTHVWYSNQFGDLGKVIRVDRGVVVMSTSAGTWVGSISRFANTWRMQ
jgi:hypothetical protein